MNNIIEVDMEVDGINETVKYFSDTDHIETSFGDIGTFVLGKLTTPEKVKTVVYETIDDMDS